MSNDTGTEGPRSFSVLLQHIDDGALHAELSETLQSLAKQLEAHSSRFETKAKGTLALTLTLVVSPNGTCAVVADVKSKAPKAPRAGSVMWLTKESNLSPENPRQQKLGLREVSGPSTARDVPSDKPAIRNV